jgi:hypothetical protein
MKKLIVVLALLGLGACRGCCMEECNRMLYQCDHSDQEHRAQCYEVASKCPSSCAEQSCAEQSCTEK